MIRDLGPKAKGLLMVVITVSQIWTASSQRRLPTDPFAGCSPPPLVNGLAQFIDGVDVTGQSLVSYPPDSVVTAQCSDPGRTRLIGNTKGQTCRADGSWSMQAPTCRSVSAQISVSSFSSQRVTSDGNLQVFLPPENPSVEVRCIIEKRAPVVLESTILVDNSRVQTGVTRGESSTVAYMFINPALPGDSGTFGCKKSQANGAPNSLYIEFIAFTLENVINIDCPRNITLETDRGRPEARVTWTEPTLQNEMGVEPETLNKTHEPGDAFLIGDTPVTYTAVKDGVVVVFCRFVVTVIDTESPRFTSCPDDIDSDTDQDEGTAVITWSRIHAYDNSRVTPPPEGNYRSGHAFPMGSTDVSYVVRDEAGNVNFCNFTVRVNDRQPPTIRHCPERVTVSITDEEVDTVRVWWVEPNATDNAGDKELVSLVPSNIPGDLFPPGNTDVEYIARDTSGNEKRCVFRVSVLDEVPPIFFECPGNQVRYLTSNQTSVAVFWRPPSAGDNIDINGPTVSSHTQGELFGLGTHAVSYMAYDPAGNAGSCNFTVTVKEAGCPSEVTDYRDGALTWQAATPNDLVIPSLERCSVYTQNAGRIRALRECITDTGVGAIWLEPRLNDCGATRDSIDLNDLTEVDIGMGNVMEVSQAVAETVLNMTSELADNLEPVADILHKIVQAESQSIEVTKAVVQTVNAVVASVYQHDALHGDTVHRRRTPASAGIIRALEGQISLVAENVTELQIAQTTLSVEVITVKGHQGGSDGMTTQFLSVLNRDDPDSAVLLPPQSGGGTKTIPKGERGDSTGISWPIDTAITLPDNIGEEARKTNQFGDGSLTELRVSFVIYQSDSLFASNLVSRVSSANTSGAAEYVTSGRVISSTVEGVQLMNLSQPVVIEFTPHREWNASADRATCVFWDFSADNGTGEWSSDGCEYVGYEDDRIVCHCNHLTNFGVLMSMEEGMLSPAAKFILDLISSVGCALSIGGVSLTLFTFLVFGNLRATRSRRILTHLSFAMLCLYVIFLAGIDAVGNAAACTAVAAGIHYFALASICWMAVEARNMYLLLVRVFKGRESKFMIKACVFAWGVPLVIVATTFGITFPMNHYVHEDFCFLYIGPAQYYGLLVPIGVILLHNIITFVLVVRSLVKNNMGGNANKQKKSRVQRLSCRLQNAICMSVLLGLSWGFGFLSVTFSAFVYKLLFCIFNSVQGFLVFMLFCVRSTDVRKAWRNAMPIECNLRGQTYKVQETRVRAASKGNIHAVEAWNGPTKLSLADGPGPDIYMYSSGWSGDGSSRWDDSKYISYTTQMSHSSNHVTRLLSISSSENSTMARKNNNVANAERGRSTKS